MTLTDAQQLRLTIQDFPTIEQRVMFGDGTGSAYMLPHTHAITSGSAFVPAGVTAWTATAATFNPSGLVSFDRMIPAGSGFKVTYVRAAFSDEEIDQFLTQGVKGGAREACLSLMFDGLRRAEWAAPDGSMYDDTAAITLLKTIYDTLTEELKAEAVLAGGVIEWAINQGLPQYR